MNCPYCDFKFNVLLSNDKIPDMAPIVCESCARVGLLVDGKTYQMTPEQLEAVKQSPAWADVIAPTIKIIQERAL